MTSYDELVATIYDASYEEEAWDRLPLALATAVGGRSATLQFFNADGERTDFGGNYFLPQMYEEYVNHFYAEDVWIAIGLRGGNQPIVADDYMSLPQYEMTSLYNDFFRRHGDDTAHCAGVISTHSRGRQIIGIHRGKGGGAFGAENAEAIRRVMPHLERLQGLRQRLNTADGRRKAAALALDAFDFSAMIVRHDRKLILCNVAAEALLNRRAGLTARAGRLYARMPAADADLGARLAAATTGLPQAGALLVTMGETDAPCRLLIAPMPMTGAALVVVDTPDAQSGCVWPAAQIYGLSAAETALGEVLVSGGTLEDFADARGVRISTARTQMSALLQKTGTSRQTQLVSRLASLPRLRTDKS